MTDKQLAAFLSLLAERLDKDIEGVRQALPADFCKTSRSLGGFTVTTYEILEDLQATQGWIEAQAAQLQQDNGQS